MEHVIQLMKEQDGREIYFLHSKRITAFTKEEAFCDAEITFRKYPKLSEDIRNKKSFGILLGKIIKESDNLMQPHYANEFLNTKW